MAELQGGDVAPLVAVIIIVHRRYAGHRRQLPRGFHIPDRECAGVVEYHRPRALTIDPDESYGRRDREPGDLTRNVCVDDDDLRVERETGAAIGAVPGYRVGRRAIAAHVPAAGRSTIQSFSSFAKARRPLCSS